MPQINPTLVRRTPIDTTRFKPDVRRARAELLTIIKTSPKVNPKLPYRKIDPDRVSRWLVKNFGPLRSMQPGNAKQALKLMDGLAELSGLVGRPTLRRLEDAVASRANGIDNDAAKAEKELNRLIKYAPYFPGGNYKVIEPTLVRSIITKHFGPIECMNPEQAAKAYKLMDGVPECATLGLRRPLVEIAEEIEARIHLN